MTNTSINPKRPICPVCDSGQIYVTNGGVVIHCRRCGATTEVGQMKQVIAND